MKAINEQTAKRVFHWIQKVMKNPKMKSLAQKDQAEGLNILQLLTKPDEFAIRDFGVATHRRHSRPRNPLSKKVKVIQLEYQTQGRRQTLDIPDEMWVATRRYIQQGKIIDAIRELYRNTRLEVPEAKAAVDNHRNWT